MIDVGSNTKKGNLKVSSQNARVRILSPLKKASGSMLVGQHKNITISDPTVSQRLSDLENTGWVYFINTTHTLANPFSFNTNEEFDLPLIGDSALLSNAPTDLQSFITNNKMTPANEGDFGIIRFEFNLDCDVSNRVGKMNFDIGVATRFNNARFWGSEDASEVEPVSVPVPYFVGSTFIANGGIAKCKVNGSGTIYDITILVGRLIHGEDI